MAGNATCRMSLLLGLLLLLAAVATSIQEQFADCSESYAGFCFHGSCRHLVSDDVLSCICSTGFVGNRCQYFDLLAVVSEDPDTQTILVFAMIPVLVTSMAATLCLCIHFCKCKQWNHRMEAEACTGVNI
ncbi:protransforming growth factor alpha-like [Heptranchias perlo]|uniref:protransforming growth factor alpha-like n=1 Tax=Heptranchias perlo TaxID=212740 RepID=UPI0035594027